MTVEELLDRISSAELSEWVAYYRSEPFGNDWQQTSYLCAMVGNGAGGKKNGGTFKPADFLPVKPLKRRQTGEQMLAIFRILAGK
jgi:hypothetical protein